MIKDRYPREWIIRQLQRFQGLSPGKGELGSHPHTDTTGGGWGYGGSHVSRGWSNQRPEYPFDERKKWPELLHWC